MKQTSIERQVALERAAGVDEGFTGSWIAADCIAKIREIGELIPAPGDVAYLKMLVEVDPESILVLAARISAASSEGSA